VQFERSQSRHVGQVDKYAARALAHQKGSLWTGIDESSRQSDSSLVFPRKMWYSVSNNGQTEKNTLLIGLKTSGKWIWIFKQKS